ncbi:hypothetical protein TrRE_jg12846, partial [Triparma retinervis]
MYDKLKVADLKALCVARGINLGKKRLKAELRALLEEDDAAKVTAKVTANEDDEETSKNGARSDAAADSDVAVNVESSVNDFLESETSVPKKSKWGDKTATQNAPPSPSLRGQQAPPSPSHRGHPGPLPRGLNPNIRIPPYVRANAQRLLNNLALDKLSNLPPPIQERALFEFQADIDDPSVKIKSDGGYFIGILKRFN